MTPKESKWIKCSERMPEIHQHVIIFPNYGKVCEGYLDETFSKKIRGFKTASHLKVYANITHWQPLPEPPED